MPNLKDPLTRYDYMWKLSRSRWAWEALRRNPEFQQDARSRPEDDVLWDRSSRFANLTLIRPQRSQSLARKWGLAFFPDPGLDGRQAPAFWSDALHPRKLTVFVTPANNNEPDELFQRVMSFVDVCLFTDMSGREQLLIQTEHQTIQIRCEGASLRSRSPRKMRLILEGLKMHGPVHAFLNAKHPAAAPNCDGSQTPRWTSTSLRLRNAMIALDCHRLGHDTFETAAVLHGYKAAISAWNSPSDAMRQRTLRSLRRGRELMNGGYKDLLG